MAVQLNATNLNLLCWLSISVSAFTADGRLCLSVCMFSCENTYFRNESYRDQRNKGQLKFYVFNISFIYMMFFGPHRKIYMCTVRIGFAIYSLSQWTYRSHSLWTPFLFMTFSFELYSTPKYLLLCTHSLSLSISLCVYFGRLLFQMLVFASVKNEKVITEISTYRNCIWWTNIRTMSSSFVSYRTNWTTENAQDWNHKIQAKNCAELNMCTRNSISREKFPNQMP